MVGTGPFIGIRMSVYDFLITKFNKNVNTEFQSILANGSAGMVAGVTAVTFCYPFDIMKRMMHMNHSSPLHNYNDI